MKVNRTLLMSLVAGAAVGAAVNRGRRSPESNNFV